METNLKLSINGGAQKVDANNYISLIGSLIYVTHTKADVLFSTKLAFSIYEKIRVKQAIWVQQSGSYDILKGLVAIDFSSLTLTFFLFLFFLTVIGQVLSMIVRV